MAQMARWPREPGGPRLPRGPRWPRRCLAGLAGLGASGPRLGAEVDLRREPLEVLVRDPLAGREEAPLLGLVDDVQVLAVGDPREADDHVADREVVVPGVHHPDVLVADGAALDAGVDQGVLRPEDLRGPLVRELEAALGLVTPARPRESESVSGPVGLGLGLCSASTT